MSVSNVLFSLAPVKQDAYELQIKFFDEKETLVSDKKFTFVQGKSGEGELFDVYSQNGTSVPNLLEHLFMNHDESGIKKAATKVKGAKGPTILVLDLKDPVAGYNANETVAKGEKMFCSFFQNKPVDGTVSARAKKIKSKIFCPDFVLCEGALKMDLLKSGGFSVSEVDYFNSPKGAMSFCKCAEFFMNAFKFGQVAHGPNGEFLAAKYIVPINGAVFGPFAKSTVLYPKMYQELYSPKGEFALVLSSVFSVTGDFDKQSKITTLSVEKMP